MEKTRYTLDIEYGSQFQKQFCEKFLDDILKNYWIAMKVHHKNNNLTINKS